MASRSYTPKHLAKKARKHRHRAFALNVLRAITNNLARFLAVFCIVAIGAGVYAGLRMFVPDMYASADAFYDRYNFADLQVTSPLGLTNDDVTAVRGTSGVRGAVGVSSYEMALTDERGNNYQVQVEAIPMDVYTSALTAASGWEGNPDAISRLVLREGRLPQAPNEIVMSTNGQLKEDVVRVGDVLTVHEVVGLDDPAGTLDARQFAVVGLVQSPEWLSTSTSLSSTSGASITNYAYIDRDALANPSLYTAIMATTNDAYNTTAFTSAYDEAVAPVTEALKAAAPAREEDRYQELRADLEAMRTQAADALTQANAAQASLQALGTESPDPAVLAQTQAAIAEAQATLDAVDQRLANLEPQHWYVLDRSANPSYYLYQATAMRMERICLIFPAFFFLVAALVSLTTMSRMVETDRVEIGTLKALGYTKGRIGLKYLLFSGIASVAGACAGIVAGVLILPRAIWTPYSRVYIAFDFLAGFHQPDCLLAFGLAVGIALVATGAAVRRTLREPAANLLVPPRPKGGRRILLERARPLWQRMSFSHKVTARNIFRYKKRMVMTIVGVAGCTALVLTGFGIQHRLDGFVQAQYGGIYTYDLVVSFDPAQDPQAAEGLANAPLAQLLDQELGRDQWTYVSKNAVIAENPQGDPTRIAFGIGGRLDQTGGSTLAAMRDARSDATSETNAGGIVRDAYLYVMASGSHQEFVLIDDYQTGERLELPPEGAVLTERLAEQLMVNVGDTIELSFDPEDEPCAVTVGAIMHNFISHCVYMSPEAYQATFGEKPSYNTALGWVDSDADPNALVATITAGDDAVISASLASDESNGYEDIATSLNSIVAILLAVSGMLAFIVIYALTEINIEERRREIATLKVLGFLRPEVRGYVYREAYVLVGLGIALGIPSGIALCDFIMRAAEFDNIIYFRTVAWSCCLFAALFTAAVTVLVTLAMRKRLNGIDMATSLKSVD